MRLAVFTNQFPGPTCTFFARDMRGLIEAGIEVHIFPIYPLDPKLWCYVPDTLNEKALPRDKVHHLTLRRCLDISGLLPATKARRFLGDALSIGLSAVEYGGEAILKSGYVLPKAWTWAQQFGDMYDHILAYWGNYTATCAYLFHRLSKGQTVFSVFLHASIDLYKKGTYIREKLLYADNVITCSEFNRQFITKCFPDLKDTLSKKIYVHRHGVDFGSMKCAVGGRPPNKVMAVGRLTKQKGFDYLIRAVHELTKRGMVVEVEVVGDGEERKALQCLAQQLNVMDRVTFSGWMPPDEVPRALAKGTVLVHSSPDLGDGVPNVIKEAMAVGTPVIGTAVAGIPELLDNGNCGMLVPPKNASALANAIETMLGDDALRRKYAITARKSSEQRFDLWQNGRHLANVLRTTVPQRN